jgi:hypothetical protein
LRAFLKKSSGTIIDNSGKRLDNEIYSAVCVFKRMAEFTEKTVEQRSAGTVLILMVPHKAFFRK